MLCSFKTSNTTEKIVFSCNVDVSIAFLEKKMLLVYLF